MESQHGNGTVLELVRAEYTQYGYRDLAHDAESVHTDKYVRLVYAPLDASSIAQSTPAGQTRHETTLAGSKATVYHGSSEATGENPAWHGELAAPIDRLYLPFPSAWIEVLMPKGIDPAEILSALSALPDTRR